MTIETNGFEKLKFRHLTQKTELSVTTRRRELSPKCQNHPARLQQVSDESGQHGEWDLVPVDSVRLSSEPASSGRQKRLAEHEDWNGRVAESDQGGVRRATLHHPRMDDRDPHEPADVAFHLERHRVVND